MLPTPQNIHTRPFLLPACSKTTAGLQLSSPSVHFGTPPGVGLLTRPAGLVQFRGQHNPFAVHTEAQNRPQGISRMLSISSRWAGYGGGPGTGGSSQAASLSPAGAAALHAHSSSPRARNSLGSQVRPGCIPTCSPPPPPPQGPLPLHQHSSTKLMALPQPGQ